MGATVAAEATTAARTRTLRRGRRRSSSALVRRTIDAALIPLSPAGGRPTGWDARPPRRRRAGRPPCDGDGRRPYCRRAPCGGRALPRRRRRRRGRATRPRLPGRRPRRCRRRAAGRAQPRAATTDGSESTPVSAAAVANAAAARFITTWRMLGGIARSPMHPHERTRGLHRNSDTAAANRTYAPPTAKATAVVGRRIAATPRTISATASTRTIQSGTGTPIANSAAAAGRGLRTLARPETTRMPADAKKGPAANDNDVV